MGVIFESGLGVPKDLLAAASWYRKAAEAGDAYASEAVKRLGN
jgi:TPR repeat protein